MKRERSKKIILGHLRRIPIIQVACEKAGISRATVYRWKNEDEKFAKDMEDALSEGEALINDMSESQLIYLIKDRNFSAIRFWLNHRHNEFRDRMEVTTKIEKQEKLTPEQEKTVREALKLASLDTINNLKESNEDTREK